MKTYKWNLDIILKNSGVIIPAIYEGPERGSQDVFEKIFTNKAPNHIIGLGCNNGNSNVFVLAGEIASVDIYPEK